MRRLLSPQNPLVKELSRLKDRGSAQGFLAEGPHLAQEALAAGLRPLGAFFTEAFLQRPEAEGLLRALRQRAEALYLCSQRVMRRLSEAKTPQGLVLLCALRGTALGGLRLARPPLVVVAEAVAEPGNMGGLIRTAYALGADAVLSLKGSANPFLPKAVRASAGALFHLPVLTGLGPEEFFRWARAQGLLVLATAARGGRAINELDLTGPLALAFGSEAHGLSASFTERCDALVRVPIRGESLNVVAASAVCLWEVQRQRGARG
jgi:TrmH family RNA methyltransferase